MSDDFPTYAEVGESNIRERDKREHGMSRLRYHVLGTPMELIDVEDEPKPHHGAEARVWVE